MSAGENLKEIKMVREKSRECYNQTPQPFPDTKRYMYILFSFKRNKQVSFHDSACRIPYLIHKGSVQDFLEKKRNE